MAAVTLHVLDLIGPCESWPADDQGNAVVHFPADAVELSKELRRFWIYVLLMAVRDNATSVHCHSEPASGLAAVYYVVKDVRYEFIPPPPGYATALLAVARALFAPPRRRFALFNRRKPDVTTASTVTIDLGGNSIVWDAVCWSVGVRAGVELYRTEPFGRPGISGMSARHPCG
ncbi:unnamed protein product [Gemmata massiliana]|uniref:Uncharacterized protein n=1 Tax=Gemmata massiliana TaxID=1210884 RepID=A0A6P2CWB1_9BACT|nr:hypothetical protein [Gemmata massiliana]VTR92004.1 unnamed protein product [Gemmata massiliana]